MKTMRVAIVGNAGSGKSTLARALQRGCGSPALDLDSIVWVPGRVAERREDDRAASDLRAFCQAHDRWIIEGCYAGLLQFALEHSPFLIFLDPGAEACLSNCRNRPWEPHKYASKEEQDKKLGYLLDWVLAYYSRSDDLSLSAHEALFEGYLGPKRRFRTVVPVGSEADLERILQ